MLKDIFGHVLEVSDVIAFNRPGYKYLIKGTVKKINPKMITVEYKDGNYMRSTHEDPRNCVKKIVVDIQPEPAIITAS